MLKRFSRQDAVRFVTKKQIGGQGTLENCDCTGALFWTEHVGSIQKDSPNMIKGLTPYQILEMLTRKKDQRWQVSTFITGCTPIFNEKNRCTSNAKLAFGKSRRKFEWNEEQEQCTRHKSYKLHRELFKIQGHQSDVHKSNFFSCYVPKEVRNTATGLAIHTKEKMHIVDSGASLHVMGLSSLICKEKHALWQTTFWIFRQPVALWSQTQAQVSTSQSWALFPGDIWWKFLRQCSRWEDCVRKLGYSCSWLLGVTSRLFPDTNRSHLLKGRLTKASLIEKQWWQMLCWIGWSPSRKEWEKVMHPLRLQRKRVSRRNAKTKLPCRLTTLGGHRYWRRHSGKRHPEQGRNLRFPCKRMSQRTNEFPEGSQMWQCARWQNRRGQDAKQANKARQRERTLHSIWRRHHGGSHNSERGKRVEKRTQTRFDCTQKQEKSSRLSEGKKVIGCKIENWNSYHPSILRMPRKILSG